MQHVGCGRRGVGVRLMRVAVGVAMALTTLQARAERPAEVREMQPTPIEQLHAIGTAEGLPLYPADPVDGFPGFDPNVPGREPRNTPQRVNYPGSVEHYTPNNGYMPKINPFNHRTLVKALPAAEMEDVDPAAIEPYREPLYWLENGYGGWPGFVRTGEHGPEVKIVRLEPGGERLRFDVGPLPTSMYVIRVVAAIPSENVQEIARHLLIEMKINDQPDGEASTYVLRNRGHDTFYSVGEFFFHVEDAREFHVELGLHEQSETHLLVHMVDVHDVLAETAKRAGKTQSILASERILRTNWGVNPASKLQPLREGDWSEVLASDQREQILEPLRQEHPNKSDEELLKLWRRQRDDAIWNAMPVLNSNLTGDEHNGTNMTQTLYVEYGKPDPQTIEQWTEQGVWPPKYHLDDTPFAPWQIVDDAGNVVYTLEDLRQNKPYPGLPVDIHTWGERFVGKDGEAIWWSPLADATGQSMGKARGLLGNSNSWQSGRWAEEGLGAAYFKGGDVAAGRDLAMYLVRFAYDMPSVHPNRNFSRVIGRHLFNHLRWNRYYQSFEPIGICETYDYLYPVIKDNQELADAVGRHVPWVQTPEDVIKLLDTYLLQFTARQLAYWQNYYGHGNAGRFARIVAYQGDPQITRPWVESIFDRTWEYPMPIAGLPDYMHLSIQRDGTTDIGSSYYTFGASVDAAKWLEHYINNGGDPQYDLTDPKRYPRVIAGLYFPIEGFVAGMQHLAVGDVGGYYRSHGEFAQRKIEDSPLNEAWRWTRDPVFAWALDHLGTRSGETDEQWAEIERVAQSTRHPYMQNRSRVLVNWGGILEGGVQSDDFRFRHAARVRVGRGQGHAHTDTLALGVWSQGLAMATSANARGGYGHPSTTISSSHNLVTVDGDRWRGHGWISDLVDLPGVHYLRAEGNYLDTFSRQVALVEIDQGQPANDPPSTPDLVPGTTYDQDAVPPRAYVVDFFRVQGGTRHQYNFQGPPYDQFEWNLTSSPWSEEHEQLAPGYLSDHKRWAARVDQDVLTTTLRWDREGKKFTIPDKWEYTAPPAEQAAMGAAFDENSPRKFIRTHVLGQTGALALTGEAWVAPYGKGRTDGEFHRQFHVIRQAQDTEELSTLYAAVFEPYTSEPFIKSVKLEGDPNNAHGYVALHVETIDGIHDVHFVDHSAEEVRTLADGTKVQGEYAYVSRDADGVRRAAFVNVAHFEADDLDVETEALRLEGRVVEVDYLNHTAVLDTPLASDRSLDGTFFEVGAPQRDPHAEHWTTFEGVKVMPEDDRTVIEWRKGADVFAGEITGIERHADGTATVTTYFSPNVVDGENTQLVATSPTSDKTWRCDVTPKEDMRGRNALGGTLTLYGQGVDEDDLQVGDRIELWEFGVGDVWRTSGHVSIRRTEAGQYEVESNVAHQVQAQ